MLDNIANLATIAAILIFSYKMPASFVYQYMFPGLALSVMIGSIAFSIMSIYLDSKYYDPRNFHTAIPMGLDAPTSIGMPLLVVGPSYKKYVMEGLSEHDAALEAWKFACATVVLIGFIKLLLAFMAIGIKIARERSEFAARCIVELTPPSPAMNGALSGVALALLGLLELNEILKEPVTGFVSLWIVLLFVINRHNSRNNNQYHVGLPFDFSSVLAGAVVGTAIFYIMAAAHISVEEMPSNPFNDYYLSYPRFANFFPKLGSALTSNLSIAIPYAILVHVGSVTVTNAAIEEGDHYSIPAVLFTDSLTTIFGGVFGGITQTTPYLGHSSFKREFKARSSYAIATGLVIGFGGIFGYISLLSNVLPKPAILPIFVFVALDIVTYAFHSPSSTKRWHAPAIIMAILPSIAQLIQILVSQIQTSTILYAAQDPEKVAKELHLELPTVRTVGVYLILAHGFILTGLLWGSIMAFMIDNKLKHAAGTLVFTSILTFFGVIHSVDPFGQVYVPWTLNPKCDLPYQWSAAYLVLAVITLIASLQTIREKGETSPHEVDSLFSWHSGQLASVMGPNKKGTDFIN